MIVGWTIGAVRHVGTSGERWWPGWVKGNFGLTVVQIVEDMQLALSVTHCPSGLRIAVIADKLAVAASFAEAVESVADWSSDDVPEIQRTHGKAVAPVFVTFHASIYHGAINVIEAEGVECSGRAHAQESLN